MTPLLFHHGLFGFGNVRLGPLRMNYFHGVDEAVAELGHPVIVSRVHPTGSIELRAGQLKQTLLRELEAMGRPDAKVVIIAHSMGGLDARYMIAHLGMADRVRALVTVCTPHHGSPYADWCCKHLGRRLGGFKLMRALGLDVQAISDLTREHCAHFNQQTPDHPGVKYYSINACRPWRLTQPLLLHSYQVIHAAEGDNDGMVSLSSGQWGECLGTWPADHLHAINRRIVPEFREKTGDITPYYLEVLARLEADGLVGAQKPKRKVRIV